MTDKKAFWFNNSVSLILTVCTGSIFCVLLDRTQFVFGLSSHILVCWLFPFTIFLFDVISRTVAVPGKKKRNERFNQWMSLAVLPYLLFGLTWASFESWKFVLSGFLWVYLLVRIGMVLLCRCPNTKQQPIDLMDWAILFSGIACLKIWQVQPAAFLEYLYVIGNAALSSLIAVLCGLTTQRFATADFAGSAWQRLYILLIAVSAPILVITKTVSSFHLLTVCLLGFLVFYDSTKHIERIASIILASIFILICPVIFPAGTIAAIWLCLLIILWNRDSKPMEGILLPAGIIIVVLSGVLIGILRWKGTFPPGNMIQGLPSGFNWLSMMVDRSNGLLTIVPWSILPLTGWMLRFHPVKRLDAIIWWGFPIVLSAVFLSHWIAEGTPPDWTEWLIVTSLLYPFAGTLWKNGVSRLGLAVIRVTVVIGFMISGLLFVGLFMYQTDTPPVDALLNGFASRTGIELFSILPSFNHSVPGVSTGVLIIPAIALSFMTVVFLSFKRARSTMMTTACAEILLAAGVIGMIGLAIHKCQMWYRLPIDAEIHLEPGQKWLVETELESEISAIKILSNLSRSAHIPQGFPVADMQLVLENGQSVRKLIQAGVHTAEWAYDRPDVLAGIQHRKPPIASSWPVQEPDGFVFQGHVYQAIIFLEKPMKVRTIEIQSRDRESADCRMTINGMGLMMQTDTNKWRVPYRITGDDHPVHLDDGRRSVTYALSGATSYRMIYLDSTLINASAVRNDETIGRISIKSREGLEKLWLVRAGVDTAEWSADRPDMIGRVSHRMPDIAYSERRMQLNIPYLAHVYRSAWRWYPDLAVTSVTLEFIAPTESEPAIEWQIHGLVLR